MFWRKKKVKVRFVDADTAKQFAQADVAPEKLPESFEAHTTLNLEGHDYEVVSAEPMTRVEYVERGELRLHLRKLTLLNVGTDELLYSLPTICDGIPSVASGTTKLGRDVLELNEDDWRQVELITKVQDAAIHRDLSGVRRIFEEQRTEAGAFRTIHVRQEIPSPIADARVTLDDVRAAFSADSHRYDAIAFRGAAGTIEGGFALETATGTRIYGTERDGVVTTLGLVLAGSSDGVHAEAGVLTGLLRDHALVLVDWCAAQAVEPVGGQVAEYLRRVAERS